MAVQSAPSDAMTVPGNSSARSMNSTQLGQLSQQLTVTADMLPRHCRDFPWGGKQIATHRTSWHGFVLLPGDRCTCYICLGTAARRIQPGAAAWLTRLSRFAGRVIFGGWPTGVAVAPAMTHGRYVQGRRTDLGFTETPRCRYDLA